MWGLQSLLWFIPAIQAWSTSMCGEMSFTCQLLQHSMVLSPSFTVAPSHHHLLSSSVQQVVTVRLLIHTLRVSSQRVSVSLMSLTLRKTFSFHLCLTYRSSIKWSPHMSRSDFTSIWSEAHQVKTYMTSFTFHLWGFGASQRISAINDDTISHSFLQVVSQTANKNAHGEINYTCGHRYL